MPSQSTTDPEKWQLFSVCNQHRNEGWNETIIQLISRHTKKRSNTDVDGWCMCFATYEKQPSPHVKFIVIMMQRTLFALLLQQHKIIVFVVIIIVRFFALFTKPSLTQTHNQFDQTFSSTFNVGIAASSRFCAIQTSCKLLELTVWIKLWHILK
jgi:hypothetical protein